MNLVELFKAEMQLWLVVGVPVTIIGCVALWAWAKIAGKRNRYPTPKGPHISLDAPCPACGNIGCQLNYDPIKQLVMRKCVHCGCVLQQQPVAPDLFRSKK